MEELLREGVLYGLEPVERRRLPGIAAVATTAARPPRRPGRHVLSHHAGLHYVLSDERPADLARRLGVPAYPARSLAEAVDGIRAGVKHLRACELALPGAHPGPGAGGDEVAARSAMLADARCGRWGAAGERWCRIVLARHSTHLYSMRRMLARLPALLTAELAMSVPLGRDLERCERQLAGCYTIAALAAWARATVAALTPHLAGRWLSEPAARMPARAAAALRWLRENHRQPVRPGDLAHALSMPAPRIAREFRNATGETIGSVLRAMRVASAQAMLRDPRRSVTAIALDCGFNGTDQLIRAFRRLAGTTPGRWRRASAPGA